MNRNGAIRMMERWSTTRGENKDTRNPFRVERRERKICTLNTLLHKDISEEMKYDNIQREKKIL